MSPNRKITPCSECEGEGVVDQTKGGHYGPGISPYIEIFEVECLECEGSGWIEGGGLEDE